MMRTGLFLLLSLSSVAQMAYGQPALIPIETFDEDDGECGGQPDGVCQRCQGDCDGDFECAEGLRCMERDRDEDVPGCEMDEDEGADPVRGKDYCYDPDWDQVVVEETPEPTPAPSPEPTPEATEAETEPETEPETDNVLTIEDDETDTGGTIPDPDRDTDTGGDPTGADATTDGGGTTTGGGEPATPKPQTGFTFADSGGIEFAPLGTCTGAMNQATGWNLCNECEGDCDDDTECGPGYVCYQRNGDEPVPGCHGYAVTDKDYCYRAVSTEFAPLGVCTGPVSPDTGSDLCQQCQGECDTDEDCQGVLVCYDREGDGEVPGCMGAEGVADTSYCTHPGFIPEPTPEPAPEPPEGTTTDGPDEDGDEEPGTDTKPNGDGVVLPGTGTEFGVTGICTGPIPEGGEWELCNECEGDCDGDDECNEGYICFQRDEDEAVPGCYGYAVTGKDYCISPDGASVLGASGASSSPVAAISAVVFALGVGFMNV